MTSDCGGGSTELSYVISGENNSNNGIKVAENPISLPYGALALKKRLEACENDMDRQLIYDEIVQNLKDALETVKAPAELKSDDGYEIYMSGGGYRALGNSSLNNKTIYLYIIKLILTPFFFKMYIYICMHVFRLFIYGKKIS